MEKKVIKACDWCGHIHPYLIETSRAKHPVHIIEGGDWMTEDMDTEFDPCADLGVWGLNSKDYEWFKAHLEDVEVEIMG